MTDTVTFSLPVLKYSSVDGDPYKALEPYIDEETVRVHHGGDKKIGNGHHMIYTNNINRWIKAREDSGIEISVLKNEDSEYDLFKILNTPESLTEFSYARNNMGGYYNHSLMWATMCPASEYNGEKGLSDEFLRMIEKSFGSFSNMRDLLDMEALKHFGSGWSWLAFDLNEKRLVVKAYQNQNSPLLSTKERPEIIPIFGIDVWEHAYYIKHKYGRADYIKDIRNVTDWRVVDRFYTAYASRGMAVPLDELVMME